MSTGLRRLEYTVIKSESGRAVGKRFEIVDGSLTKSHRHLSTGTASRRSVETLAEFAHQFCSFDTNEVACFGVCPDPARIVPKAKLDDVARAAGVISRSREFFHWPSASGILFFDYDTQPGTVPLEPHALIETLREALPFLSAITIVHKPSSSSLLRFSSGEEISGICSQHMFLGVQDAREIPQLGKLIIDYLWLAGLGRIDVTAAGHLVERTILDTSVWQPERLIFHRADCGEGVTQDQLKAQIFPGSADQVFGEMWLTLDAIPTLSSDEKRRIAEIKNEAKLALAQKAKTKRREFIDERVDAILRSGAVIADPDDLKESFGRALESDILPPELELTTQDGQTVTVRNLLEDPKRWHLARFADPIEPSYRNDERIAVAVLTGIEEPYIYSHAHGGIRYGLQRETIASGHTEQSLRAFTAKEFAHGPSVSWLVKGLLPKNALAMVYGPSGSGKSFWVLDLIWSLCAGREFATSRTKKCKAIYVVAEGVGGFRKRLLAAEEQHGPDLSDMGLTIIPEGLDLRTGNVEELVELIREVGGAEIIVIDTLAQCVAGADENSAQDMGTVLKRCNHVIAATGATLLLVHHAGKALERGARGWSGIRAALDTEICVTRDDHSFIARVTKQKDGDEGKSFPFALTQIQLGLDEDGDEISSCVVKHLDSTTPRPKKVTGRWQILLSKTLTELARFGAVRKDTLLTECMNRDGTGDSRSKEKLKRAMVTLVRSGEIIENEFGEVSHKTTNDTQMHDLRCGHELPPTPHDSMKCGEGED